MNSDVIDAKFQALAVAQNAPIAAPQLLDALRPAERVALLTEIADVVKDVIEKQGWYKQIGPKKHILIQGWTFIGSLGGCSAKTVSTEKIDGGFKASAVVVRVDSGVEVGAADQVCMSSESKWRGKDDYALMGMASTRACSRALSTTFRHVVELAGYSATPAEEMDAVHVPAASTYESGSSREDRLPSKQTSVAKPTPDEIRRALVNRARALGVIPPTGGHDELRAYCEDKGIRAVAAAIGEHLTALEAQTPATGQETAKSEVWRMSDAQRSRLMGLHADARQVTPAERYAFYTRVCGRPIASAKELGKLDYETVTSALKALRAHEVTI